MSHPSEEQSPRSTSPESKRGPLSYNQQALWFASRLDATAYNLAYGFRIRGTLEPELLKRALALLVARHAVLRTTFSETEHGPLRVAHRHMDFELQHVEARHQVELLKNHGAVALPRAQG